MYKRANLWKSLEKFDSETAEKSKGFHLKYWNNVILVYWEKKIILSCECNKIWTRSLLIRFAIFKIRSKTVYFMNHFFTAFELFETTNCFKYTFLKISFTIWTNIYVIVRVHFNWISHRFLNIQDGIKK